MAKPSSLDILIFYHAILPNHKFQAITARFDELESTIAGDKPREGKKMHSALVRIQNVFGFFTTVAFVVGALIAASDLIGVRTPSAVVTVDKIQVYV